MLRCLCNLMQGHCYPCFDKALQRCLATRVLVLDVMGAAPAFALCSWPSYRRLAQEMLCNVEQARPYVLSHLSSPHHTSSALCRKSRQVKPEFCQYLAAEKSANHM